MSLFRIKKSFFLSKLHSDIPVLVGMLILLVSLPILTFLVQQNQETRSKAATWEDGTWENGTYKMVYGNHVDLALDPEYAQVITDDKLNLWVSHLDQAYEDYTELTGWVPYSGTKMRVQSIECGTSDKPCYGWAWSIQINQPVSFIGPDNHGSKKNLKVLIMMMNGALVSYMKCLIILIIMIIGDDSIRKPLLILN